MFPTFGGVAVEGEPDWPLEGVDVGVPNIGGGGAP